MKSFSLKIILFSIIIFLALTPFVLAEQTNIYGPDGSSEFGKLVVPLPNGNIVVTDPSYSKPFGNQNVGAVYLYDGKTGQLISRISGTNNNDSVGIGGVTVLKNGNFVVLSSYWQNEIGISIGAVTLCDSEIGCSGEVSESNSAVGSIYGDLNHADGINDAKIIPLTNNNYVIWAPNLRFETGGGKTGAVTLCNGSTGCIGKISKANSLVIGRIYSGSGFFINRNGVTPLPNGNFVVNVIDWENEQGMAVGASTLCNGETGCIGEISESNSLIGTAHFLFAGSAGITVLPNSNYVVGSPRLGAATYCSGDIGCNGRISESNSFITDLILDTEFKIVTLLTNGNYVVNSPYWKNGKNQSVGAVTLCSGETGCQGYQSEYSSLTGSSEFDNIGNGGIVPLANGNYVVASKTWHLGSINVGAATLCNGIKGCPNKVNTENSLIGSNLSDFEFVTVTPLINGNYVVSNSYWDNENISDAGAVTFCDGNIGCRGGISSNTSIVGLNTRDFVGSFITPLANGNYVIGSPAWDNNTIPNVGAATWCNGKNGCAGVISAENSLIGSPTYPLRYYNGITPLANGNYVIQSGGEHIFDNVEGTVTWCNGENGCIGSVPTSNSMAGYGTFEITALPTGDYMLFNSLFANSPVIRVGAVVFGNGRAGTREINADNSVIGTEWQEGFTMFNTFDPVSNRIIVGRPLLNKVTLLDVSAVSALVSVGGKVQTASGRGLPRAVVSMTDSSGQTRTSITNPFGYYRFKDVAIDETYVFGIQSKSYSFAPQVLNITGHLSDLNFTAQ